MMTPPTITITTAPARKARRRSRWLHGTAAVIALLASAADVLLSALTGWPEIGRVTRVWCRAIADAWHHGAQTTAPPRVYIARPTWKDTTDDH
jgi:hypothetical protein